MGTISMNFLFKESGSTRRIDNPTTPISESRTDIQLPDELITEINVRLPVKSLLRFKCVSKSWLSLISDPQFIRSHFSNSSSMDDVENSQLLFTIPKTGMKICSLYSVLHEAHPSTHVSCIEFPVQNEKSIVGIINGLVCLNLKGTDLCIWNPALNKIKHLNAYPDALSGGRRGVEYFFSFGYEESNDDYKVVCLQTVYGNGFDGEVRIYSLKAGSWRRIDQLKGFYLPHPGVFAYGKIYWPGDRYRTPNSKYLSLDMSSRKFAELQPPEYPAGDPLSWMGVTGGRPFVSCDHYKGRKVDLFVLDKRGVEESWCKLASITYTDVNYNEF